MSLTTSYPYPRGFQSGEFHHAVLSISGTSHTLYLDGSIVATNPNAGNIFANNASITKTIIGANNNLFQNAFQGMIDDVRVYNYEISSTQVSKLYVNRNLVVHYLFDTSVNILTPNYATLTYDASFVGNSKLISPGFIGTSALSITNSFSNTGIKASQYVISNPSFNLNAATGLTISCWINTDISRNTNNIMRIFDIPYSSGTKGLGVDILGTNMLYSGLVINIPTNGLVAHFNFDGTIGSTSIKEIITSATISTTTPEANRAVISNSKFGTGCLNCTNSKYFNSNNVLNVSISTQITISFWLKSNIIPTSADVCAYIGLVGSTYNLLFNNYTNGTRGSSISLSLNNDLSILGDYPLLTITDTTTWNHLSITINGTNWVQYMNGIQSSSGTKTGLSFADTYTSIMFGNSTDLNEYSNCYFDDFRIYNRALSSTEIYNLYAFTQNNYLVLYWPFDTDMNEIINGYTATLYGTTSPTISNSIFKVGIGSLNCSNATVPRPYVKYTNANGILPISNTYTFSFWYYPTLTSPITANSNLFSFCNSESNNSDCIDLLFATTNSLNLFMAIRKNADTQIYSSNINHAFSRALTVTSWNHVALSITSTSSTVYFTLWINNVKSSSTKDSDKGIPQVTRQFAYINGSYNNISIPAYVDDFRVYTTLLTDDEVTTIFNTR